MSRLLLIMLIFILAACSSEVIDPTSTATATATSTLSQEDITAAAQFQPTLPASFTPTFTPTITATPTSTFTPTASFTPTPVPEDILCLDFSIAPPFTEGAVPVENYGDLMQFLIPYDNVIIVLEIRNADTGELIDSGTLGGNRGWVLDFANSDYAPNANYEWIASLTDLTREGMCEQTGQFDTFTAEVTPEMTVEATPVASPESTAEATSELTEEAIETSSTPIVFPPR